MEPESTNDHIVLLLDLAVDHEPKNLSFIQSIYTTCRYSFYYREVITFRHIFE